MNAPSGRRQGARGRVDGGGSGGEHHPPSVDPYSGSTPPPQPTRSARQGGGFYPYSTALRALSLRRSWWVSMNLMDPVRERITTEWVRAPLA